MRTNAAKVLSDDGLFEIAVGIRLRSWALPALITFTPWLQELAIGPFYIARERTTLPF